MRAVGAWFRHHAPDVPADRPTARGWRWNPGGVRTLYLASTPEACRLELLRLMERVGFRESEVLPRALTRFRVRLEDIVALRDARELARYGLVPTDAGSPDFARCQAAAASISKRGAEGIVARSAVSPGETLAVFTDNLAPRSRVEPAASSTMHELGTPWAWRRG